MLHFAYGANMSRAVMHRHAQAAVPIGIAQLADYRFLITADGHASIEPQRGGKVHGVLWRLTPRDHATLSAWENIAAGRYRVANLPILQDGRRRRALVYLARQRPRGRPKPGYMELVIAAALEWQLPHAYIAFLRHWLLKRPTSASPSKFEEYGWT